MFCPIFNSKSILINHRTSNKSIYHNLIQKYRIYIFFIELPSVTVTPEIQFPFEDTSKIILQCVITSSPTASTVGWQRTSLDGYSTVPIVVANSNGKYHVDNSLEHPHLTINDISLVDEAYYACFAINDGGKGISNGSRVDVIKCKSFTYQIQVVFINFFNVS